MKEFEVNFDVNYWKKVKAKDKHQAIRIATYNFMECEPSEPHNIEVKEV